MADVPPLPTPNPLPPTPFWWRLAIAVAVVLLGSGMCLLDTHYQAEGQYLDLQARSAVGILCLLGLAACFSANLRAVNWRTICFGLALQLLLGWLVLKWQIFGLEGLGIPNGFRPGYVLFESIGNVVNQFIEFSKEGAVFVFGVLAQREEVERIFGETSRPVIAFTVLPPIIFISSFFTILYFFGILQFIVRLMARAMMYLMGTSGAETLSSAANVFMGQTEAPLIVKPYIPRMTQSELLALMVGGMATISGSLMAVYIGFGGDRVAILATSVMAAPCGLYMAKLILPETDTPATSGELQMATEETHANVIDAAAAGASDGMRLAINVAAMLIAFLALLAMVDYLLALIATGQTLWQTLQAGNGGSVFLSLLTVGLGFAAVCWLVSRILMLNGKPPLHYLLGQQTTGQKAANILLLVVLFVVFISILNEGLAHLPQPLQLKHIFAVVFSPLAYLMGVRVEDIPAVANLLGTKIAANEFVAFLEMNINYREQFDHRSLVLTSYALTGFANFGSVGIQLGGIGAMAPGRRSDLARLGMTALLVGFLVTVLNASVAGMLSDFAPAPPASGGVLAK